MQFLTRLAYRPEVNTITRALRIRSIAKWLYYYGAAPGGVAEFEVKDIRARFYVRTPAELRIVEGTTLGESIAWGEREVLELLVDLMRSGGIFYDVGANFGIYSILLAKAMGARGQVIAFEPDRQNYERLEKNVKLNGVTNVRCFRKALGEASAKATLYHKDRSPMQSSLLVRPGAESSGSEQVDVEEGDRLVAAENLPIPTAIKIDVEGYEYCVIQGLRNTLTQPCCKFVSVEIHPDRLPPPTTTDQILDLMKSLGFNRIDIHPRRGEQIALCYKA